MRWFLCLHGIVPVVFEIWRDVDPSCPYPIGGPVHSDTARVTMCFPQSPVTARDGRETAEGCHCCDATASRWEVLLSGGVHGSKKEQKCTGSVPTLRGYYEYVRVLYSVSYRYQVPRTAWISLTDAWDCFYGPGRYHRYIPFPRPTDCRSYHSQSAPHIVRP